MHIESENVVKIDGEGRAYPDVGEMHTVPIETVLSYCLRDVCYDRDDERDGDVLKYEGVGPLFATCQPIPLGLQTGGGNYMIPLQAAPIALRLLQLIKKTIP